MTQPPRIEGIDPAELEGDPTMRLGGFMEHLGLELDLLSPDRVEAHLTTDERHQQPYGIVHGGVYCALVETLGSIGAALRAWHDGNIVVGVTNTTDFLRAHRTGRLDCVATPIHPGRTQQLWEVRIQREDGALVARGQVRLQALPAEQQLAGKAPVSGGHA